MGSKTGSVRIDFQMTISKRRKKNHLIQTEGLLLSEKSPKHGYEPDLNHEIVFQIMAYLTF